MKRLPARSLALVVVLCLFARPASAQEAFEPFADSLLSAQIAKHHIPGAVLTVVRNGRIAFARGYGYADLENHVPVDPERTIFRVASVSKLFTATAAMQLVEQGKLDLHADVNQYLRRFQIPASYARPVTLFDLLTHTAGFDESNIARKAHHLAEVGPLGDYLALRMPARIRPPGELIVYSNHGMALAGYLVEVASGMPFDQAMHDRIFAPLGMRHSGFELKPDSAFLMAAGYQGNPPRRQAPDYTRTIPASMMSASGTDVARFMVAHLEGGSLLSDSSLAEMHRRQFSQDPMLAGIGFGFWERFQNGERALWHDGDASGFASLLYLLPERHTGYFMAFNSRAGNRARREILAALLDHEISHSSAPAPRADPQGAAIASRIAGTYVDLRYGHTTLEKIASLEEQTKVALGADGTLLLEGGRYVPISERVFQSADGWGHLSYRTDRAGGVTHLFEARSIAHGYERVPWYGTVTAQLAWLGFCVLGFLWYLAVAAYQALSRKARPHPRFRGAIAVLSALNLIFVVGFACALAGLFGSLEYSVPPALTVLLSIPLVTTGMSVVALLAFARFRRGSGWSLAWALAAALAFIPWLAYWNLLGYRF